jgi:hypothetical protein
MFRPLSPAPEGCHDRLEHLDLRFHRAGTVAEGGTAVTDLPTRAQCSREIRSHVSTAVVKGSSATDPTATRRTAKWVLEHLSPVSRSWWCFRTVRTPTMSLGWRNGRTSGVSSPRLGARLHRESCAGGARACSVHSAALPDPPRPSTAPASSASGPTAAFTTAASGRAQARTTFDDGSPGNTNPERTIVTEAFVNRTSTGGGFCGPTRSPDRMHLRYEQSDI